MQTYKLAPEKNVNFQFKTKLLAVQQWAMPLKRKWQSNMLTDFDSKESLNHHKSHISFMKHPLHLWRECKHDCNSNIATPLVLFAFLKIFLQHP